MALKLTKPDDAYTPNLQDKRVQKRVSSVLAWCDSNLFEHQPTNIRAVTSTKKGPPSAKKLSITDVFGQQQNPLSKWLRYNLLIQSGIYHPGKLVYGYRLREGAVARIRSMMGETAIALSDLQKYEKKYQYELDTLEFNYREKSERLWHGLQNIWPSPTRTDTFDRYDVPIGGIKWHVKDECFQKSLSAKQSSW